jgi:hypothetical protein
MIEDYINGEKFRSICDFDIRSPRITADKTNYIIYADLDRHIDALSFISQHKDKKFVLVTHNGDREVKPTNIPFNLVHWYTQNLNFRHHKISAIPIGLENPQWHPSKVPAMMSMPESEDRVRQGFCQYNPDTYPQERKNLVERLQKNGIDVEWFPSVNGQYFGRYLFNLKVYKYCFCPRGNGIDTHRTWEAMYMGCIPIVKRHITHEFEDSDLPIVFVDEWEDFNYQDTYGNFNSKLLTMDYWRNKICSHYTK